MGLEKLKPLEETGNLITVQELGVVLNRMKSIKTPSIDWIISEFLKFFWGKIKYFVMEAINCGFHKGSLSTSMHQCIIVGCAPCWQHLLSSQNNLILMWMYSIL